MYVIHLLNPILDAMLKTGSGPHPPRPWLGMRTQDPGGKLIVDRLSPGDRVTRPESSPDGALTASGRCVTGSMQTKSPSGGA